MEVATSPFANILTTIELVEGMLSVPPNLSYIWTGGKERLLERCPEQGTLME